MHSGKKKKNPARSADDLTWWRRGWQPRRRFTIVSPCNASAIVSPNIRLRLWCGVSWADENWARDRNLLWPGRAVDIQLRCVYCVSARYSSRGLFFIRYRQAPPLFSTRMLLSLRHWQKISRWLHSCKVTTGGVRFAACGQHFTRASSRIYQEA